MRVWSGGSPAISSRSRRDSEVTTSAGTSSWRRNGHGAPGRTRVAEAGRVSEPAKKRQTGTGRRPFLRRFPHTTSSEPAHLAAGPGHAATFLTSPIEVLAAWWLPNSN